MSFPRFVSAITVTLLLQCGAMHAATTASCTFNTFSTPSGYTLAEVDGVSDDGTVVGQLLNNSTLQSEAFHRSASGVITKYAAPQSSNTWLYGRNGVGVNAGYYQASAYPGHLHGFMLQGSTVTAVNHPNAANTWLFDVNLLGASVGSFSASASVIKGFRLVNGTYTTIAYPNALTTYAVAINDGGEIVGYYASSIVSNGFVWKNGTFTTVNYPNSAYGTALLGVNNSGVIVGNRLSADQAHGFIYENGTFKNIVYSGGKFTMAGGINNNGLISGEIYFVGGSSLGYTAVCK